MGSVIMQAVLDSLQQDHFQQGCQRELDRRHLEEMNIEKARPGDYRLAKKVLRSMATLDVDLILVGGGGQKGSHPGNKKANKTAPKTPETPEEDPDKLFRTYPSFDPVFMKV